MNQPTVLILADDADFARSLVGRWQVERSVPAFTLMGSESWSGAGPAAFDLAVVGPVHPSRRSAILRALESGAAPVVSVVVDVKEQQAARAEHPRIAVVRQHDGWADTLIVLCTELLRRVDANVRARRSEQAASTAQRHATLGRYMIEMRHSFNNALTSVLGNAELLLLEPGALSAQVRDQVDTIHTMAMRMHEIMQRFSSLESEMTFAERESHSETKSASHAYVPGR